MQQNRDPFGTDPAGGSSPGVDTATLQQLVQLLQQQTHMNQSQSPSPFELPPARPQAGIMQSMATASPLILAVISGIISISIAWTGMRIEMAGILKTVEVVQKDVAEVKETHKTDLKTKLDAERIANDNKFLQLQKDIEREFESVKDKSKTDWRLHDSVFDQHRRRSEDDIKNLQKVVDRIDNYVEDIKRSQGRGPVSSLGSVRGDP